MQDCRQVAYCWRAVCGWVGVEKDMEMECDIISQAECSMNMFIVGAQITMGREGKTNKKGDLQATVSVG